MADVVHLGRTRRELFSDERGAGLRATWHADLGVVVLSLWRDDLCVGTFRLSVTDAGRLATFLVARLGEAAAAAAELRDERRDTGG